MDDFSQLIGELQSDIKWIREKLTESDDKYAPMWVKYPVYGLSGGVMFWALTQLLGLITIVRSFLQ